MFKPLVAAILALSILPFAVGCEEDDTTNADIHTALNAEDSQTNTDTVTEAIGTQSAESDSESDVHVHAFSKWATVLAPSCTKGGLRARMCSCGEKEVEELPESGHTETVMGATAATCTQTGLTEGKKCSACNTVLLEQSVIPITEHVYDGEDDTVCNTCGYERNVICLHENTVTIAGKKATCIEDGVSDGEKCTDCNTVILNQEVIPAFGHKNKIISEKKATCQAEGYTGDTVCAVCNAPISKGKVTAKTDHVNTETVGAISAAPGKEGYTGDVVCKDCGITVKKGTVIPALKNEVPHILYTLSTGKVVSLPMDADPWPYTSARANKRAEHDYEDIETKIADLTNAEREKAGLAPLTLDENGYYFTKIRAEECHVKFSHTRPDDTRWLTVYYNEGVFGMFMGENLFKVDAYAEWFETVDLAQHAVDGWMNSKGHRENILNSDYKYISVAVVRIGDSVAIVQNFFA